MAVTQVSSITLTNAIAVNDDTFVVSSTAALSVDNVDFLVFAGKGGIEVCRLQAIPVSGTVQVFRGQNGTRQRAHAANTIIYYGTPDVFKQVRDNAAGVVGNSATLPEYCTPGTRARDGAGNEYVMVDLTSTCYSGTTVVISNDGLFNATQLAGGAQGAVGVTVEEGTSNSWVWAQIYGYNAYAQETIGDSAGTSALVALAATTPSTPSVGLAAATPSSAGQYLIEGMFIAGIPTTATTSATSSTGVAYPVFLNYPFVRSTVISLTT